MAEKTKIEKIPELSSLGVVQLICGLEDEFDIEIPNSALKKIKTVGDVVKFLEKNA
jgi:acyl carrier protein